MGERVLFVIVVVVFVVVAMEKKYCARNKNNKLKQIIRFADIRLRT